MDRKPHQMNVNILELIDFKRVDALLEGFNKSTGFVTAILDLEGNVLSKSGWRQICTKFHRINPETSRNCTISDTVFAGQMAEGQHYRFYKCMNGVVDVAVPLIVEGKHVANLFSGQFFLEEPDREFFKTQARKYGFDEDSYLNALASVPIVSKEKAKIAMDFLRDMTLLISDMTLQKLEQSKLYEAVQEREERFRTFMEETPVYAYIKDGSLNHVFSNKRFAALVQSTRTGHTTESAGTMFAPETADQLAHADKDILSGRTNRRELEYKFDIGGEELWLQDIKFALPLPDGSRAVGGLAIDITERKRSEAALQDQTQSLRARNDDLSRFNRVAVDRELVMIDLKRRVNALSVELGRAPPFDLGAVNAAAAAAKQ